MARPYTHEELILMAEIDGLKIEMNGLRIAILQRKDRLEKVTKRAERNYQDLETARYLEMMSIAPEGY